LRLELVEDDAVVEATHLDELATVFSKEAPTLAYEIGRAYGVDTEQLLRRDEVGVRLLRRRIEIEQDDGLRLLTGEDRVPNLRDEGVAIDAAEIDRPAMIEAGDRAEQVGEDLRLDDHQAVERREGLQLDDFALELAVGAAHDGKIDLRAVRERIHAGDV